MRRSTMGGRVRSKGRRGAPGRRLLIVLAVVSLVIVGLPVMAYAARPSSTTTTGADFSCESDIGFLGVNVFEDPEFGEAFLGVFFESFEEPLVLSGFLEEPNFDGTTLYAEVEMFLEEGSGNGEENGNGEPEPVGVAIIDATWDPTGESDVFMDRFRDGNRWVEIRDTFTQADMTGTAFLADFFDYDLSECWGNVFESVVWTTNPNAFNSHFSGHFLECALAGPGDGFLIAEVGEFGPFMSTDIFFEDGRWLSGFTEEFVLTDTEVSGTIELFDNDLGEQDGEALVAGVLEVANVRNVDVVGQDFWTKVVEQYFDVSGTVDVDGSTFEMVECFSVAFDVREHFSNPSGPKPGGKTPANDAPDGALSLEDRGTTNAQTNGAANAPEAECIFTFEPENGEEPDEFPLPIGKTLWYTFEGTGGEVTVDSAGSNFDTILGVYDAGMDQLACVDDVETETSVTLQAAATIETEEGATYYVQIGGFGFFEDDGEEFLGEFGRIRLNMS